MDWFLLAIWIIIAVAAIYIDMTTSAFLFVWFAIGAVVAIIALILGQSATAQLIIFAVVSLVCLSIGYPLVKKTIKKTVKSTPRMEETYIGREFVAEMDIVQKGNIKVDGIYWTVRNDGAVIKQGERAKIIGIDGNKLVVKK